MLLHEPWICMANISVCQNKQLAQLAAHFNALPDDIFFQDMIGVKICEVGSERARETAVTVSSPKQQMER